MIQHFEEALESAIALAFFIPLLIGTDGKQRDADHLHSVATMALGVRLRDVVPRAAAKEMTTSL